MRLLLVALLLSASSYAIDLTPRSTNVSRDATLTWTAPVTREDGTPLTIDELESYELVKFCSDGLSESTLIAPTALQHTYTALPRGVCEFAISATDVDGLQSEWSETVSITVKPSKGPKKMNMSILERIAAWFRS